jgi:ABC-type Mn2+/Zn2+ transport system ATPase subunit
MEENFLVVLEFLGLFKRKVDMMHKFLLIVLYLIIYLVMAQLSDGQKSRVVLAKMAKESPHMLVNCIFFLFT